MASVQPSGKILAATIHGIDLSRPIDEADVVEIRHALGQHGVVCFPNQNLDAASLKRFAGRFGELEINVAGAYNDPDHPEVMTLSNITENGKALGLADAGQDWHTDMSYSSMISFANVLFAIEIPRRNGEPLGCTEFANMHEAYDDLPPLIKKRLITATATHDFNKFWEMMRREKGSKRPPLTDEQRRKRPPVSHPVFMTHPITGRKVLYANPGYTVKINELSSSESDEMLAFLFAHQLDPKYRYRHRWNEGDVLMWDNIGTIHNAVADYLPHERRMLKRCQVMADQVLGLLPKRDIGAVTG